MAQADSMHPAFRPDWIRDLRSELGLTQTQLAERLGVTAVTVSRWENGQSTPNRLAIKAMTALAGYVASRDGTGRVGRSLVQETPAPYVVAEGPTPDTADSC